MQFRIALHSNKMMFWRATTTRAVFYLMTDLYRHNYNKTIYIYIYIIYIYYIYYIYINNILYIYIYIYYIYKNSYLISTTADNIIQYLHVESNHPQNIVKQIPKTIEKHLLQLSIDKEIFNESAPFYEDQVHQSGY